VETQDGGKEMKIEILSELENPLLKRKQFEVKVIHDAATPSLEEIREKVSVSKGIGKGVVIVDSFTSQYGSRETVGTVKVYQTKERAFEIEPKSNLIKNGLIEGEKKEKPKPEEVAKEPEGEKPAEAKEEKPKEPKEEPKPEEKADKKPEEAKEEKSAEKPKEEPKPDKKEDKKTEEAKEEKPAKEQKEAKEEPKPEEKATEAKEEKPKEEKKGE
jgi:ribosomal protein S24E